MIGIGPELDISSETVEKGSGLRLTSSSFYLFLFNM
jgi:hypothetical protein